MIPKYKIVQEIFHPIYRELYRVQALRDFGNVKRGDIGGWIRDERCLAHDGLCWAGGNTIIADHAFVSENAVIDDNVIMDEESHVFGNARVTENVYMTERCFVYDDAFITGSTRISGSPSIYGNAIVNCCGHRKHQNYVDSYANMIDRDFHITDMVRVSGHAVITGNPRLRGKAVVFFDGECSGSATLEDNAIIIGGGIVRGNATVGGDSLIMGTVEGNIKIHQSITIHHGVVLSGR